MQPIFRIEATSDLTLRASQEALAFTRGQKGVSATASVSVSASVSASTTATATALVVVKNPELVRSEARDRVKMKGSDPTDHHQVLAESELQLGQYRGQTFRWLLENDVGYAVTIIVSHEGERDKGGCSLQTALMVHKDALVSYAARGQSSDHEGPGRHTGGVRCPWRHDLQGPVPVDGP